MDLNIIGMLVVFTSACHSKIPPNETSFRSNILSNNQGLHNDSDHLKRPRSDGDTMGMKWTHASNAYEGKFDTVLDGNNRIDKNITQNSSATHENVLIATELVHILSFSAIQSNGTRAQKSWTIVPKHKRASVSVMKRDNIVSGDIFKGGCSNVHISQSFFNRTSRKWCKKQRLLPCNPIRQIQFNLYGYSPVSEPGRAIDIAYTPFSADYGYGKDDSFSIYYYECGGIRNKGILRSPRFPPDADPSRNLVYCKWDLLLERGSDYGVLKFPRIHLPDCKNQQLTILQDTLLHESEVTENLLEKIQRGSNRTQNYENQSAGDDASEKYINVYRDVTISSPEVSPNPKSGIHLVQQTEICGLRHTPKSLVWRKERTNVTLILHSKNSTLRSEGFSAIFTAYSLEKMLGRKAYSEMEETSTHQLIVPNVISNYIALIILVPVGFALALSTLICMLKGSSPKRSSPHLHMSDREKTRTRSGASYFRGQFFTTHSSSTTRNSTLHRSRSRDTISSSQDSRSRVFRSRKRKGSIIHVKHFIGIRKLSLKLKTVYEEESSNQSKCDSLLVEEQKGTEPTVT